MNRWFALVLFFPVLIVSVSIVILSAYKNSAYEEFMQLRLNSIMNNANDAALFIAQESRTVNNAGNIELDPDDMWATYKAVFLSSFGIYDDYHSKIIDSYTPAVLVAVNDGYFLKMRYDGDETGYRFSQKLPYSVIYQNDLCNRNMRYRGWCRRRELNPQNTGFEPVASANCTTPTSISNGLRCRTAPNYIEWVNKNI